MEQNKVLPIYLAKKVELEPASIEALSESLAEKLSTQIVDKFFQGMERLCIDEDSGLIGLILKNHLDEIFKKEQREQLNQETGMRIARLNESPAHLRPRVTYESRIDVAAENRKWEQQKREEGLE